MTAETEAGAGLPAFAAAIAGVAASAAAAVVVAAGIRADQEQGYAQQQQQQQQQQEIGFPLHQASVVQVFHSIVRNIFSGISSRLPFQMQLPPGIAAAAAAESRVHHSYPLTALSGLFRLRGFPVAPGDGCFRPARSGCSPCCPKLTLTQSFR